jgi:hypothetical protein
MVTGERLLIQTIRRQISRAGRGLPVTFTRTHVRAIERATSMARTLAEMLRNA